MSLQPTLSEASAEFCFLLILLVPLAGAGLALLSCGLGRSRSAAHSMLASLCVMATAAITYVICGFRWQGAPGTADHVLLIGAKSWSWIAASPFLLRGMPLDLSSTSLIVLLQIFSVALTALIPLSSGSDRWRLSAMCFSTVLLAGWTYPLFAHWVWGGGWLAQLGANRGLGRGFLDGGGSGAIQAVGGLTALSVSWILGPRRGKYSADGMPAAIPGHSVVLVLLGCFFAWLGWLGLNSAGAILFAEAEPSRIVLVAVNTTLAAGASLLATLGITRHRFGRPDASLVANGWVAGLVASSAGSAMVKPAAAMIVGLVAGTLIPFAVDLLEFRFAIDDPGGAISVHAIAGLWGLLALGLLADVRSAASGQWLAQLIGIATLIGFVLPLSYALNWLLDRVHRQRVDDEGEQLGMDLHELGASAYPEFASHSEEFMPH